MSSRARPVMGWPPNLVYVLIAMAIIFCCIPMAMPQAHLPAFCSDLGILPSHGAAMLSVLLGAGFLSRQFWGWFADQIGGLTTVLVGSAFQIVAMTAFLMTQNEIGAVHDRGRSSDWASPASSRPMCSPSGELFPASEASWRIPTLLLFSGIGMATGGWLAGVLYDYFGFYAPAFAAGVAANAVNLLIVGTLVFRQNQSRRVAIA